MTMTSVDLPPELVASAKKATGIRTTRGVVTRALEDLVYRDGVRQSIRELSQMDWLKDLLDPEIRVQARR